jgi:hypothetical protein
MFINIVRFRSRGECSKEKHIQFYIFPQRKTYNTVDDLNLNADSLSIIFSNSSRQLQMLLYFSPPHNTNIYRQLPILLNLPEPR